MPLILLFSGVVASSITRMASSQRRPSDQPGTSSDDGAAAAAAAAAAEEEQTPATLEEVYEVGEVLGHGHFATVRRATHRESGEAVAVKAIQKTRTDSSAIRREIEILRRVGSHKNIVNLLDVFETETEWHLVMELVTGGELFEKLVQHGPYSEKEASVLMKQIGEAISWLHTQGVCHRDLKPENLLLATTDKGDLTVKICDFGLSVALGQDGTLSERQGTWAYWAPEMFTNTRYGKEVDMWSLGVILYIILSGRHPFDAPGRSDAQMRAAIQSGKVTFAHETWSHVSYNAKDLIRQLLQLHPRQRLGARALLQHNWIQGTDVSEVPISGSDTNLQQYQIMRHKWSAALVASLHRQATLRKRNTGKGDTGTADKGVRRNGEGGGEVYTVGSEERELLADAFQVFDPEGKGYIDAADLGGVIRRLGQQLTPDELSQMLEALHGGRSGKIHYQDYLNLASTAIQEQTKHFKAGTVIFREGDRSDYFYLITSGRVRKQTRGQQSFAHARWLAPDEELTSGDYFGTSAILGSGERMRHSTMVAVTDVQVVALAHEVFDAGSSPGTSPDGRRPSAAPPAERAPSGGLGPHDLGPHDLGPPFSSNGMPPRRHSTSPAARRHSLARSLRFINMMSNNKQQHYSHGASLFHEGDEGTAMYIIKSGRVEVACDGRDGRKHTIGQRGAGECCGETSCLSQKPRNTTVTCVSPAGCDVLCVSRDDFLSLVRGSWDVARDLVAASERKSKERERRVNFRRTRDEVSGDDEGDEDEAYA